MLLECRGHVIVSGSGTSHAVALRFAHLLSCCGTPALFLHPGDSQHGAAGAVRSEDVWIGLSKGGETSEVCFLAGIARKRGAAVVAITERPASTLGELADLVLEVSPPADVDPYGMVSPRAARCSIRPSAMPSAWPCSIFAATRSTASARPIQAAPSASG